MIGAMLFILKLTISLSPLFVACFIAERVALSQNQAVPAKVWSALTSTCLAGGGVLFGMVVLLGGTMAYQLLAS